VALESQLDRGVGTMKRPVNCPLRSDVPDKGERQALPHLFAGAFDWVRNSASQLDVSMDDANNALEQLMLASPLLRITEDKDLGRRAMTLDFERVEVR